MGDLCDNIHRACGGISSEWKCVHVSLLHVAVMTQLCIRDGQTQEVG